MVSSTRTCVVLTTKFPIHTANGEVIGLIGFSRECGEDRASQIPADFAAALDDFERNLSEDVTSTSLAQRSHLSPQRLAPDKTPLRPHSNSAHHKDPHCNRVTPCETNQSVAEIAEPPVLRP